MANPMGFNGKFASNEWFIRCEIMIICPKLETAQDVLELKAAVSLEQRVFGHDHRGLLLVVLQQLLGDVLLVDDQAEHVFAEPAGGHDETALLSPVAAPRVLNLPLQGLALGIEIDGCQGHGVCRTAVERRDALGLRHVERGVEERGIVEAG